MSPKKIKKEPDQTTPAKSRKRAGRKRPPKHQVYPIELRRKAVRLYLEEGVQLKLVAEELGVSRDSVIEWGKRYRKLGEAGLERRPSAPGPRKTTLPPAVHAAIRAVKQEHPAFGVRRIAQWLQRSLFLPASPETVRRSLHQAAVPLPPPRQKRRKNRAKPRFFERATPNQLWQSDIFTFQLNGQNAHAIAFIDDHSRFIVGIGLYRAAVTENVLEVYRRAAAQYGAPKEMLTDQGRQYAVWQGKTRFQRALARDHVKHLLCRPHHPMTQGKIERFWKTLWGEFLERARFDTIEQAVAQTTLWVQYYNHKRPHSGIGNVCPAERYFAIHKEMRETIERGIADNVEELALRGKPQEPFYMVGRVGGKNVVFQTERGQLKIMVDGKETGGKDNEQQREDTEGTDHSERQGEVPVRAGGVDGAAAAIGDLQGSEHPVERTLLLAGTGDGGYATSLGTAHTPAGGPGADAAAAHGETPGPEDGAVGKPDRAAGGCPAATGTGEAGGLIVGPPRRDGHEEYAGTDGGTHRAGTGGHPDGDRGGPPAGDLPQDLLRTGGESAAGDGDGAGAGPSGEAPDDTRSGGCPASGSTGSSTPGSTGAGTTGAHPAGSGGC
jgi:transposase InsO family protein